MFDIGWSELLILGVVTLIFVGPKELPVFLRTIGKYVGMLKSQAAEFRAHFDAAMREAEIDQLKKDVENAGREVTSTIRDAEQSVRSEMDVARREFDTAASMVSTPDFSASATPPVAITADPEAHDADGLPMGKPDNDVASIDNDPPRGNPDGEPPLTRSVVRPGG